MPPSQEFIAASIAAGKQEVEDFIRVQRETRENVDRVGRAITLVEHYRDLETNRDYLRRADDVISELRTQTKELRRLAKKIAHRKERRENGVYLP